MAPNFWPLLSRWQNSVNDAIPETPFSVQFVRVDSCIHGIMAQGHSTLLVKLDVASTYHNVTIHPSECPLLGMKWQEKYFCGHGSLLWSSVHTIHVHCYRRHGLVDADLSPWCWFPPSLFTIDEFLTLGPPSSLVCYNNLQACIHMRFKAPTSPRQAGGPIYLSVHARFQAGQERVHPVDKRECIITLLES